MQKLEESAQAPDLYRIAREASLIIIRSPSTVVITIWNGDGERIDMAAPRLTLRAKSRLERLARTVVVSWRSRLQTSGSEIVDVIVSADLRLRNRVFVGFSDGIAYPTEGVAGEHLELPIRTVSDHMQFNLKRPDLM